MTHPSSLLHPLQYVCQLRRAIYSLKQAPRAWFERFHTAFLLLNSLRALITMLFSLAGLLLVLPTCFSMDDMVITGDDESTILSLKQHQFPMKDLGHLCYFLGLR